jgi:protein SCO1
MSAKKVSVTACLRAATLVALSALLWTACSPAPKPVESKAPETKAAVPAVTESKDPAPGTTNIYEVKGVVTEIRPNGTTAIIRHEEIPGYMKAMTMPLSVKEASDLAGVKAGDTVSFRMLVTADDGWIDNIQVLGHSDMPPVPPPTTRLVRNVDALKIGDTLPNYPFVNEFGKDIKTDDFRGKAVALTFIFTRCPMPNFCPRLTSNFKRAYETLEADPQAPKNWHLLSLSFDVQMDTPPVLRAYAQRARYNPEKWSFLTGALIEVDDITERFGLVFSREEGTFNFDHRMRTVVIDTRGRVYDVFIGNEWKVDDLVTKLKEAAKVPTTGEAPPIPKSVNAVE